MRRRPSLGLVIITSLCAARTATTQSVTTAANAEWNARRDTAVHGIVAAAVPGRVPSTGDTSRVDGTSDVVAPNVMLATAHRGVFSTRPKPRPDAQSRRVGSSIATRFDTVGVVSRPYSSADPWWAPLASAALPGAGQAKLKQDRFVAYLAVEGFLWLRYANDRREGIRQRDAYRNVALQVSRAAFAGPKPSGNFEYYERMEHWVASGVFDADPSSPGLDPETDSTTFNGAMWLLARRTYWTQPDSPPAIGSPAYLAALRFYEDAAVRPDFQWSWRNARFEQDIYRRHIKESNDAFRHAIQDVGVVIANHMLSTVDAYISLRLRLRAQMQTGGASNVGISASIPWSGLGGPGNGEIPVTRAR
jgi:hypothetical protein